MSPEGWEGVLGWDFRVWAAAWEASAHLTRLPVSQGAVDGMLKGEYYVFISMGLLC